MKRISTCMGLGPGLAAAGLLLVACNQRAERNEAPTTEPKRTLVVVPFSSDRATSTSAATADASGGAAEEGAGELTVDPPDGVVYLRASREVNDRAIERVKRLFSSTVTDRDVAENAAPALMCGPGLWGPLSDLPEFKRIPSIPAQIVVPQIRDGEVIGQSVHAGRVFQTAETVQEFWMALGERYDLKPLRIRKLSRRDMQIYWAMIPYDIEEPVFMVTTSDNDFLVDFAGGDLLVFAVDDFRRTRRNPNSSQP